MMETILRFFNVSFVTLFATLPLTALIGIQIPFVWQKLEWLTLFFPDNLYTKFLFAECIGSVFIVGIFWIVMALNFAFIIAVYLANWLKLLG